MMESDNRYLLFTHCYAEAEKARREQIAIPSPFYDQGIIDYPWPVCQEFYEGNEWARMGQLPAWKTRPVSGWAFRVVEAFTTQLTDSKPRVAFQPRENSDEPLAKLTQGYFDYWWEVARGATALYLAVKDSRKFGVGWLHLSWSQSKKTQELFAIHPEAILVDPDCTADDFDPTYLIYEYVAQVGELKNAYKDANWDDFQKGADTSQSSGMFDRVLRRLGIGNTEVVNPATSTVVYEFWLKDSDLIEFDVHDEALGVTAKKRKKKYPNGRLITIAGGIVLDDRESPYKHGEFPFVPIHAYPESGKFHGRGDISNIMSPIMLLNRVTQLLMDGTLKNAGGIALVNPMMGLFKKSITNDPVQVREVKDVNAALKWIQTPAPPRHLFEFARYLEQVIQDYAGLQDISQGKYTPGNKTAEEAAILNESSKTRVRMAARNIALSLQILGKQWLSNTAQFDDMTYIIRIAGEEGEFDAVEFNPKEQMRASDGDTWELSCLDLIVDDVSTLPANQRDREQLAMELFGQQVIDVEELLKTINWPNYKAVLARMATQAPPPPEEMLPEGMPPGMPPPGMQGPMPEMPMDMMGGQMGGMMGGGMEGEEPPPPEMLEAMGVPPEVIAAMLAGEV